MARSRQDLLAQMLEECVDDVNAAAAPFKAEQICSICWDEIVNGARAGTVCKTESKLRISEFGLSMKLSLIHI